MSIRQRPPLYLFQISNFPWRNWIYTNFNEEEGAEKKTQLLCQYFQKLPKNSFLGMFFKNFACGTENLVKLGYL